MSKGNHTPNRVTSCCQRGTMEVGNERGVERDPHRSIFTRNTPTGRLNERGAAHRHTASFTYRDSFLSLDEGIVQDVPVHVDDGTSSDNRGFPGGSSPDHLAIH